MHTYLWHLAYQQATNHRGQMQLDDNFYYYTLHQHQQNPDPYPWPTPEQFRATPAWPGDRHIFQEEASLANAQGATQGNGGRAKEDEDMMDLIDYFMGGKGASQT